MKKDVDYLPMAKPVAHITTWRSAWMRLSLRACPSMVVFY
jgi:hypothetical protein